MTDPTPQETDRADAAAANARVAAAEHRALRAEVAAGKGVPAELLDGATREDLEARADALLAFRHEASVEDRLSRGLYLPNADRVPDKIPNDTSDFARDLFGPGL